MARAAQEALDWRMEIGEWSWGLTTIYPPDSCEDVDLMMSTTPAARHFIWGVRISWKKWRPQKKYKKTEEQTGNKYKSISVDNLTIAGETGFGFGFG